MSMIGSESYSGTETRGTLTLLKREILMRHFPLIKYNLSALKETLDVELP